MQYGGVSVKNLNKKVFALLIALGVVLSWLPLLVYGSADPRITLASQSTGEEAIIKRVFSEVNSEIKENVSKVGFDFLTCESKAVGAGSASDLDITVTMALGQYKKLDAQDKQDCMKIALETISNSDLSAINRTKIYNFVANNDTSVSALVRQLSDDVSSDYASAYSYFRPFTGVLGTILGIISISLFTLLGLTVITDVSYLTIPFITDWLNTGHGDAKPKFVSMEAWQSVRTAEQSNGATSKTVLGIYLKMKIKTFVALFILLIYMTSGKLFDLIASFMNYFQGLVS